MLFRSIGRFTIYIPRNGFRERLEIFSKRVQDLDKCLGMDDALFLKYLNEKKAKVYHHLYKEIYVYFFLSIPIPGFIPSDRFAWNGPLRLPLLTSGTRYTYL